MKTIQNRIFSMIIVLIFCVSMMILPVVVTAADPKLEIKITETAKDQFVAEIKAYNIDLNDEPYCSKTDTKICKKKTKID